MAHELAATTEEAAKIVPVVVVGCDSVFYWEQKGKKGRGSLNVKMKKQPNQRLVKLSHPCAGKHHAWQHAEAASRFLSSPAVWTSQDGPGRG